MPAESAPRAHALITGGIAGVALLAIPLTFALGSTVAGVVAAIIALAVLQGLWRGAAEIVAILVAMALGTLLARPLGHAIEGPMHSMTGADGIANRVVAIVVAGTLVTGVFGLVASRLTRAFLKGRPNLRAANRYAGAAFGLVEGVFLSLLLVWTVLAIGPMAKAQVAASQATPRGPSNPTAERVARLHDAVERSSLAAIAGSTNPLGDAELVQLASDFSEVMGDEEARRALLESEALKNIQALASVRGAIERVRQDPQLGTLAQDRALSGEDVQRFLNSPTVLDILDHSTIVDDVRPFAPDLALAIREAKASMRK